jgi:hypothetical protein
MRRSKKSKKWPAAIASGGKTANLRYSTTDRGCCRRALVPGAAVIRLLWD